MEIYINFATGSIGDRADWWYENETGDLVNAVDRGEVVKIEGEEFQDWENGRTILSSDGFDFVDDGGLYRIEHVEARLYVLTWFDGRENVLFGEQDKEMFCERLGVDPEAVNPAGVVEITESDGTPAGKIVFAGWDD
jgi:hypothetical protein